MCSRSSVPMFVLCFFLHVVAWSWEWVELTLAQPLCAVFATVGLLRVVDVGRGRCGWSAVWGAVD